MKKKTGKERLYALGGLLGEEDPKPKTTGPVVPVYKTQAEIDAANAQARRIASRGNGAGVVNPEDVYVARKVGDPVAQFLNPDNTPYTGKPVVDNRIKKLPMGVRPEQIQSQDGLYWYENNDGNLVEVDPIAITGTKPTKPKMAMGGETDDTDYNKIAGIANAGFGVANTIMDLLENNPNAYSKEPLVNPSTLRAMVTPYANGGEVDGDLQANLQSLADEYGVSVEELIEMVQGNVDGYDDTIEEDEEMSEEETFAMGGIHIKKKNRGKFKEAAKKAGLTVQQYARKVLKSPTASPTLKKRANFAKNAAKWKHAMGGEANSTIEVEGGEVMQTPDGAVHEIKGPKHENGGVDVNVPSGTKIYSDRVKIDGKTMEERKLSREKGMSRLQKMIKKNPYDTLLKSTIEKTSSNHQREEEQDMAIQNVLNAAANPKKFAYGGVESGDPVYGVDGVFMGLPNNGMGFLDPIATIPPFEGGISDRLASTNSGASGIITPVQEERSPLLQDPGFTVGDYVGMAGNLFNAVAPIVNTNRNRQATQPNINRFMGIGKDAIAANDVAQDIASETSTNKLIDINSNAQSAKLRNRNSAQSVNTVRALDAVTDMGVDKARNSAYDAENAVMVQLLGQRGQQEFQNDFYEMQGEAQRDIQDKQDTDNYYSNMAENLVNFGTNVQGLGSNLNAARRNKVDVQLLSQLSRYGLSFDKNGNLISTKNNG